MFTRRADAIAYYVAKTGLQPAKSWTIKQMVENADAGKIARNAKASAKALYVKKMGVEPAKSWTGNKIMENLNKGSLPRSKSGSGMTVKELLVVAKELNIKGRHRMVKADLVAAIRSVDTKRLAA